METPVQPAPQLNDEADGAANTLTTTKKIEANRRNAQFSTGPKSPEGKKIVAGNARKHCLLAKDLVIVTGDGRRIKDILTICFLSSAIATSQGVWRRTLLCRSWAPPTGRGAGRWLGNGGKWPRATQHA